MNCKQARQLCHDRLDGLIAPRDEAALSAHVATCAECRVYCGQMDVLSAAFADLAQQTELMGQPDTGIGSAPAMARGRAYAPAWLRFGRVAAAIALLVGGGYYAYRVGVGARSGQPPMVDPDGPTVTVNPQAAMRPARIVLAGVSADDLMFVRHKTKQPRVHLFRLHHVFKAPQAEEAGDTDATSDS